MRTILLALKNLRYYATYDYWKNYVLRIFSTFFSFFGIVWLVIETANHFKANWVLPSTDVSTYLIIISVVFLFSVIFTIPKLFHVCQIADKDVSIEIVVDDFFKQKGDFIIATNSTFDTRTKDGFISEKSLQHQLASKYYKKTEYLDQELITALRDEPVIEQLGRQNSKSNRYAIGTVAKLNHDNCRSYWVALADINEHGKPKASFQDLQECLTKLWFYLHTKGHINSLVIPVIGSGLTGINEPREKIVKEIIFSFVAFASESKITEKLTIVIYPKDFLSQKINYSELCQFLDYTCKFKNKANIGSSIVV